MSRYYTLNAEREPYQNLYGYMMCLIAPRPIAWVSTQSPDGKVNLAPFSFFNVLSLDPLLLGFSPLRSGATGKEKDTIKNVRETFEAVINVVSFSNVEQMNLTSSPFPAEINEMEKAGLTPVPSEKVSPPRVGEAVASFECKVEQIITFGNRGGSGSLVVCRPLLIHIKEDILEPNKFVNQSKADVCGRLGGNFYSRNRGESLFTLPRPAEADIIGWDNLPDYIKQSEYLTGNEIARLAMQKHLPTEAEIREFMQNEGKAFLLQHKTPGQIQQKAKELLAKGNTDLALKLLLVQGLL